MHENDDVRNFFRFFGLCFLLLTGVSLLLLINGPAVYRGGAEALNKLVGGSEYAVIYSDSRALLLHLLILVIPAAVFALVMVRSRFRERFGSYLYGSLVLVLSLFLLFYGMDKLLLLQFPRPGNNLLFTRTGDLSREVLYWTSMGAAPRYQVFSGIIELIPALLLLFRQTRFAGLCVAFMVLMNVFFINIGFGVSVRMLSIYLVLLCLVLLWPYRQLIAALLTLNFSQLEKARFPRSPFGKTAFAIFTTCVLWLLYGATTREFPEQDHTFEIRSEQVDCTNWRRGDLLHVHPEGYVILQYGTDFKSYACIFTGPRHVAVPALGITFEWQTDTLKIHSKQGRCLLRMHEIDRSTFRLLR